ncbi:MAG: TetR/AcrR family transcriptional regulator [Actinomycetota bacterium]|nr:TetR/AcrR family transcriptional regulator [Actinomycetota bacterium]
MTSRTEAQHPRAPLSRETIIAAAAQLVERDGLEALSMRKVAAVLGVEAMSLYHHIAGKEALLDAIVELAVASMDLSASQQGTWQERLKAIFRSYRALAHSHPAVFPLVGRRPVQTLAALAPVDAALGILREAGFSPREALTAFRTLSGFAYGYALAELRGLAMESAADERGPTRSVLSAEAERFPHLAEVIPHAGAIDRDVEVEAALDIIIAGLTSTLRSHGAGADTAD